LQRGANVGLARGILQQSACLQASALKHSPNLERAAFQDILPNMIHKVIRPYIACITPTYQLEGGRGFFSGSHYYCLVSAKVREKCDVLIGNNADWGQVESFWTVSFRKGETRKWDNG
jgi:hypothetical protein